ncbi:MAG: NUDIX hydrolase [Clostridiales bacterium]|nr:NUDIX hydrolase [Clostridiales bacterium]
MKKNFIYNGKILSLRKDDIILPNGAPAVREVIEHSGGSAIYCEKDGKILLVKQFRYPYKEELYEIPAGKLNDGESPEETAIRELEEEGGIKAKRVEKLFDIYPTPAYTNEIIRLYKAVEFIETESCLDEDEFLSNEWIDKCQVKKMIENGQIKDAKTIIAVLSQVK